MQFLQICPYRQYFQTLINANTLQNTLQTNRWCKVNRQSELGIEKRIDYELL